MNKKKKRKVINAKKVLLSCGIILISMLLIGNSISKSKKPTEWTSYTVQSGDTVYGIAKSITPNSNDYRYAEYYIIEENNIENAMIHPGQVILVPVYE